MLILLIVRADAAAHIKPRDRLRHGGDWQSQNRRRQKG
jgi:hypothetical protein